jgi:glycosyltransferase involved in cell wall biosynthesis
MNNQILNAAYFEPLPVGSHQQIAAAYRNRSRHWISLVTVPYCGSWIDSYFAGSEILAEYIRKNSEKTDVLVATDLFPLADACMRGAKIGGNNLPVVLINLEHQFGWPLDKKDKMRFSTLPFSSVASVLVSNISVFQTQYSLHSFLNGLKEIVSEKIYKKITSKCRIIPAGVDLTSLLPRRKNSNDEATTILFNHRCDSDKNIVAFFKAARVLKNQGYNFKIIITGSPNNLTTVEIRYNLKFLRDHIEHFGWVESRSEYADLLWRSDVVVSTSYQEFFGISVIEGIFCDCFAILPNKLTYPEIIPAEYHDRHLYGSFDELVNRLKWCIENKPILSGLSLRRYVKKFDWRFVAPQWDDLLVEAYLTKRKAGV